MMKTRRATTLLFVVFYYLTVLSVVFTAGEFRCKYNEFVAQDVVGKLSCVPCRKCPEGYGLSPQCGSYVSYGTHIKCAPCIDGETFSSTNGIESCQPCGICVDHQKVLEKCNRTHNSNCSKDCEIGFYLSSVVGDCQECSWCCDDSIPFEHEKQCEKSGVPFYKQCTVGESIRCQPRCTEQQYVHVSASLNKTCHECPSCGVGQGLYPKCQSVFTGSNKPKCQNCMQGKTFSKSKDSSTCKPCTVCEVGKKTERTCNMTHDTLCGDCKHGFYKESHGVNKETTCKQCSFCCGDKLDVIESECKDQGMPKERQCSYTSRAITKCAANYTKKSNTILITVITLACVLLAAGLIIFAVWHKKYRNKYRNKYSELASEKVDSQTEEIEASSLWPTESPSSGSTATFIEFRKSGVTVQCQDAAVGETLLPKIFVESHWGKHQCLPERKEIYLSPLIQFKPHGLKPGSPMKLDIPHSAYKQEVDSTWKIKILKQASTRELGSQIEFTELTDPEMKVNNCSVKFTVEELAAYIVVGVPGDPKSCAKKRMQCVVYGIEPKIGQSYSINLYLLDDVELSHQKLRVEQEREGCNMLQKMARALYPDVDDKSEIDVDIENVNEGWDGRLSKQAFKSSEWNNSYKTFPKIEATFRHTNPQIRDFQCTFSLKFKDVAVAIPVFHFSEPEYITNGIQACDSEPPTDNIFTSFMEEDQLSLSQLSDLPDDVLQNICRSIDQAMNQNQVESVAPKIIPSITPEEVCFIKNSDQPFTSLISLTKSKHMSLNTAKLHSILHSEGLIGSDARLPLPV